jgi:nitrogen regulatory protein P-II 1
VKDGESRKARSGEAEEQEAEDDHRHRAAGKGGRPGERVHQGRSSRGHREKLGLLGLAIQPEKEIIIIVLEAWLIPQVMPAMVKAGKLDQPGIGFVFVVSVDYALGMLEARKMRKT